MVLLLALAIYFGIFSSGSCMNATSRPAVVNIGAVLAFNSSIGKVAKVAIDAAVDDVNSDPNVLRGTKLVLQMQNSNGNGFISIMKALQFMEVDVVAIIGPQSSETAHVVSHVANELHVPLLSFAATDPTLSSLQYPFFVRTTQSDLFQMTAIAEMVDHFGWKQVIAIYLDDDYGRNGVAALGDQLAERHCKISYKAALSPTANKSDVTDLLYNVAQMESRVIVLHANPNAGLLIFSVAQSLQMMTDGYVWIATDWLAAVLDSLAPLDQATMSTIQGVLTLRQHTANSKRKSSFISNWSNFTKKEGSGSFHLNAYAFYAYDTVWMLAKAIDAFFTDGGIISFSDDPNLRDLKGGVLHLEAMNVFDGGNLLLDEIKKTDFVGLTGRVAFGSDGNLIHPAYDIINVVGTGLRMIGFWSNYSGLSVLSPEMFYSMPPNRSSVNQRLYNPIWPGDTVTKPRGWVFPNNGKELRIGVPNRVSYRAFVSKSPGSDMVQGYCIDVFVAAVNLLPYAVPYQFVPFGNGLQNPSYRELVTLVASKDFDAAVGDIAIVTNRTRIVDFTQPYIESGLVVVTAVKKRSSNAWAFLRPFTVEMWCVTGLFFLFVGAVIWILEHRFNTEFRGPPKEQLVTILWFSFSTLFFAHRESIVSTLGRAVLIIWLFVVLIIQSSYTASLTSILTVQQLSSPVRGIDSLIASKDPIGFQVGSFAENYLVEEMGISKSRLKSLGSPAEYAKALELGPNDGGVVAVVDERPYVELFLSTNCQYSIVGPDFTKSGWGFAFPRDSPLAIDMSTAILTLSENGDLQRIHDKWLTRTACSSDTSELDSSRLQLSSFWGLFLICGVTCFLALLTYFIMMLRQFIRYFSQQELQPPGEGSLSSGRSIQKFLSFVGEKAEEVSKRSQKRSLPTETINGTIDIES